MNLVLDEPKDDDELTDEKSFKIAVARNLLSDLKMFYPISIDYNTGPFYRGFRIKAHLGSRGSYC